MHIYTHIHTHTHTYVQVGGYAKQDAFIIQGLQADADECHVDVTMMHTPSRQKFSKVDSLPN